MTKEQVISQITKNAQIPDEVWEYYAKTKDCDVRNAIFSANEGLVIKFASQYGFSEYYQDIVQSGYLGLLYAVDNYHISNAKFSTYASKCIQGYIFSCINELFGLPNRNTKVNKAYIYMKKTENASFETAVKKFHLSNEDRECLASMLLFDSPISLDSALKCEDNSDFEDLFYYDVAKSEEEGYNDLVRDDLDKEITRVIYSAASKVMSFDQNQKTKDTIESVFGLGGKKPMRQTDYAKQTGVSKQVVNQKALKFIARMKHPRVKREIRKALQIPDTVKDCDVVRYLYG